MKKLFLTVALMIAAYPTFAQESSNKDEEPKEGWSRFGNFSLIFSQAAFNAEWQGGGTSNYAGALTIDYNMNYKKDRLTWDNSFHGEYGLTKNKDEEWTRKTSDRLEIHSVLGYQVEEGSRWYYSFFLDFRTQFAKGYEYTEDVEFRDPVTDELLDIRDVREENTRFMSPGYLKFGPGMLYKNGELLKVNLAPASARFVFADKVFTTTPGYVDGDYFGLDQGKSMRFEFGASLDVSSKFTLVENVELQNTLRLYSNYLEDPQNVDLDYTLKVDMKINSYLSANFIFQALYDDNAVGAFQIREGLGVGFSYKL